MRPQAHNHHHPVHTRTPYVASTIDRWIEEIEACGEDHRARGYLAPSTVKSYSLWLRRFRADFRGRRWDSLSESDVLRWLEGLGSSGRTAGSTLMRCLNRSMLGHLLPESRHWRGFTEPRYWRPEEYRGAFVALLEAYQSATDRRKPVMVYLVGLTIAVTGMRRSEAAGLRWDDMRPEWIVVRGKGGRKRRVPRTSQVNEILTAATPPGGTRSAFVFRSERRSWVDAPVSVQGVTRGLRRVFDDAGLPEFSSHHLRRCFVSEQYANGVDVHVIARTTGHSVDVLRRHYLMVEWDAQMDACADIGRALSRQGRLF